MLQFLVVARGVFAECLWVNMREVILEDADEGQVYEQWMLCCFVSLLLSRWKDVN